MSSLFENYGVALLDASFFARAFSESVRDGLEKLNVYVADTFNTEIEQYKTLLPPDRRSIYEANIAFLRTRKKPLGTLSLQAFGERGAAAHNDTWGLLNLLAGIDKAKFVLVTADQLLIQRVMLNDVKVDIYDLTREMLVYASDFSMCKASFELHAAEDETVFANNGGHSLDRLTVYRRTGDPIALGKIIKSGAEADIFSVLAGDRGAPTIAKIFKRDKLSAEKYSHIQKIVDLNRTLRISWALFPLDIVFYDFNCTIPAGFTEHFAATKGNLDENPLYLGDLDMPEESLNTRLSASLQLCLQVVKQVHYLNSYGFLISDFNLGNFALLQSGGNDIQMWDTDSFGYGDFFSGYCAGGSTSREYDITKKLGAIDFCSEALYLFAFNLLSLGDTAISEYSGKFKFNNPNYGALFRKNFIPENLWNLFEEVFTCKKLPSTEILLQQLYIALDNCKTNPAADKTYRELLTTAGVIVPSSAPVVKPRGKNPPKSPKPPKTPKPPKEPKPKKGMPRWLKIILLIIGFGIGVYLLTEVFTRILTAKLTGDGMLPQQTSRFLGIRNLLS